MVRTGELLDVLLAGGRRADRLTHVRHLPAREGVPADWPTWADADLVAGYRALGVDRPWQHQADAAEAAWSGRHTVLSTSTGSGKSLAFWLPSLSAVRAHAAARTLDPGRIESVTRRGSVLYLCPTKALAADQRHALDRLLAASGTRDVRVSTCDGDSAQEERRWVQEHADVVLTNPDFLHFALLPQHRRWARLLGSLRYVVLDECHAFRGVFGAHVAAVLRRLRRVAGTYGADPVFLLASATTAEPAASAARLVGVRPEDVVAVSADASPAGRKTVALWQPAEVPAAEGPWSGLLPEDDPWALPLDGPPVDVDRHEARAAEVEPDGAAGEDAADAPGRAAPASQDPASREPAAPSTAAPDP
ncbi:DEAD/DEAH box helicase, partial [Cellulomonas triticagri]|uniref:DEAD/DEAH box helicase n=1 Tax=Cellulomonas triticagri TaxID=2483352 RepID=UPI001F1EF010